MRNEPDPDRTRLDLNPAAEPPPPQAEVFNEPVVEEGISDPDHRKRRVVRTACTVVNAITGAFALVLAVHIVLVVGEANPANGFASFVDDWSSAVSLGLRDLFTPANVKVQTFLNDGVAAIGWLIIGGVINYLIRRLALPGPRRQVRYRRVVR
jgi:hypothetical protein